MAIKVYRHTPNRYTVHPGDHIDGEAAHAGHRWRMECPPMFVCAPWILAIPERLNIDGTRAPDGTERCYPIVPIIEARKILGEPSARIFRAADAVKHFFLTDGPDEASALLHAVRVVKGNKAERALTPGGFFSTDSGEPQASEHNAVFWRFECDRLRIIVLREPHLGQVQVPELDVVLQKLGLK